MNWKDIAGVISAVAALAGTIAALTQKSQTHGLVVSGNQNLQIQGDKNSVTISPMATTKALSIPIFKGQLKEDDRFGGPSKSFALAKVFNKFISDNEGKIVKLDVFGYYTDEEWGSPEKHDIELTDGFPDPRHFSLAEDCNDGFCSGVDYEILGSLREITYNASATSRFIRGYISVSKLSLRLKDGYSLS